MEVLVRLHLSGSYFFKCDLCVHYHISADSLIGSQSTLYYLHWSIINCYWYIQVENTHQRMDGIIVDFCDGDVCANHPLFSRDPIAIQILLYYDDVEVVNPLGFKTSKHKFAKVNCCYSWFSRDVTVISIRNF